MTPYIANILIMSGYEDGAIHKVNSKQDGQIAKDGIWLLRIGRDKDNDIYLPYDTFVSRHHARLYYVKNHWVIYDENSSNGVFVETDLGDIRIKEPRKLSPNQRFKIGRTWLQVEMVG